VTCEDAESTENHEALGFELLHKTYALKETNTGEALRLSRRAVAHYKCAIKDRPTVARLWGDIGWGYYLAGDLDRAWDAQEILRRNTDNKNLLAASWYSTALLQCKNGDWKASLQSLNRSLKQKQEGKGVSTRKKFRQQLLEHCK
jgi:hypothetical protein